MYSLRTARWKSATSNTRGKLVYTTLNSRMELKELRKKREDLLERHVDGEDVWDELQDLEDRLTEAMIEER